MKSRGVVDVFCYQINPSVKDSLDSLARLDKSSNVNPWSADQFQFELSRANRVCYGIEWRGEFAGYTIVKTEFIRATVLDFLIHKDHRRKGLGRELLKHIDERLMSPYRRVLEITLSDRDLDAHLFLKQCRVKATDVIRGEKQDLYLFRAFHLFSVNPIGA